MRTRLIVPVIALVAVAVAPAFTTAAQAAGPSYFPAGTKASASSHQAGHAAARAIDHDASTSWSDATPGRYPDVLTITPPSQITTNGLTIVSEPGGIAEQFCVYVLDASSGRFGGEYCTNRAADNTSRVVKAMFPITITDALAFRIVITKSQGGTARIAEVENGAYS